MGRRHFQCKRLILHISTLLCSLLTSLSLQAGDGSRQPTKLELTVAEEQGKAFYQAVSKVNFS